MALIAPLRGLRYNLKKVKSLKDVITPPYDVISPDEQDQFYLRHQHNIIRLILGKIRAPDNEIDNRYTRAAKIYKRWWIEETLIRDPRPAIYLYQIKFPSEKNGLLTRKGFISLLRLDDYHLGHVKPHERTFSATRQDRLKLITACQTNFSPIFAVYDDPRLKAVAALEESAPVEPVLNFEDRHGVWHTLWPVTDAEAIRRTAQELKEATFYLADGHHRYETSLAYRDMIRTQYPQAPPGAPFNYTLIYAAAMQDHGLIIRPAHRLIKDLPDFELTRFLKMAVRFFDVEEFPLNPDPGRARLCFKEGLAANGVTKNIIGFFCRGADRLRLLTLKPRVMAQVAIPPALKSLDVIVLNEILYGRCLGLSLSDLDNEKRFLYDSNLNSALDRILRGEIALGLLLNPTRIEQVQSVANAGLIMPRKSTYFYPKVVTGLIINPIIPSEVVVNPLAE